MMYGTKYRIRLFDEIKRTGRRKQKAEQGGCKTGEQMIESEADKEEETVKNEEERDVRRGWQVGW